MTKLEKVASNTKDFGSQIQILGKNLLLVYSDTKWTFCCILGHAPYKVPFLAFHTLTQSFTEHLQWEEERAWSQEDMELDWFHYLLCKLTS